MFNQEKLPIIRRDDISNLKECIVTEIFVKMNFVSSCSYIGPKSWTVLVLLWFSWYFYEQHEQSQSNKFVVKYSQIYLVILFFTDH